MLPIPVRINADRRGPHPVLPLDIKVKRGWLGCITGRVTTGAGRNYRVTVLGLVDVILPGTILEALA